MFATLVVPAPVMLAQSWKHMINWSINNRQYVLTYTYTCLILFKLFCHFAFKTGIGLKGIKIALIEAFCLLY